MDLYIYEAEYFGLAGVGNTWNIVFDASENICDISYEIKLREDNLPY
jgi:hypothetical protein